MTSAATLVVPDLVLAIDLGGSQTKAIASVPQAVGKPMLLCMDPETADVSHAAPPRL